MVSLPEFSAEFVEAGKNVVHAFIDYCFLRPTTEINPSLEFLLLFDTVVARQEQEWVTFRVESVKNFQEQIVIMPIEDIVVDEHRLTVEPQTNIPERWELWLWGVQFLEAADSKHLPGRIAESFDHVSVAHLIPFKC